jgi:protein-S-isoprenylcysteine O-methyltransferase Ste14
VIVRRLLAVSASIAFLASLGYFVYAYAQFGTPAGRWHSGAWWGVAQNVLMFAIFAAHHSVIARQGTKRSLRKIVPPQLERSGYVAGAAILFALTLSLWQDIPGVAWRMTGTWFIVAEVICLTGVVIIGISVSSLDLLAYLGLRQGLGLAAGPPETLTMDGPYRFVRHPVYLGWILLVWSLPVMTGTRLVFAAISTIYMLLVMPYEERSFRRAYGTQYEAYTKQVRWRLMPGIY